MGRGSSIDLMFLHQHRHRLSIDHLTHTHLRVVLRFQPSIKLVEINYQMPRSKTHHYHLHPIPLYLGDLVAVGEELMSLAGVGKELMGLHVAENTKEYEDYPSDNESTDDDNSMEEHLRDYEATDFDDDDEMDIWNEELREVRIGMYFRSKDELMHADRL
ncbi:hypothetical protein E3N88_11826 [Mikania micrantha]|uniref:Uncharacterized protein n=1 Tax=Mikania micrantha TaxID=192012 RepID=A0A5N6P548_9ASTR|nr:hypothetical protein E3N88_11826 [Mikania micrantha]